MNKRKLTKKELQERKIIENKKFNKTILISMGLLFLVVIIINVFFTFWCDTKYEYRKMALYGKEIRPELVCVNHNSLQYDETSKIIYEGKTYFICSSKCSQHLINHPQEVIFIADAFSGDTICKADALMGFKERGSHLIVYFKNRTNFNNYYASKTKK
ncbi:MAG: hypothetical protein WAO52_17350 [Prolixibacteraceae bacterium]